MYKLCAPHLPHEQFWYSQIGHRIAESGGSTEAQELRMSCASFCAPKIDFIE